MAKFASIFFAAIAIVAGVQAQCPPNALLCGSEILDVFRCASAAQLERLNPHINPSENIRTDIYPTNDKGEPQIPSADCSTAKAGCQNSNLSAKPPQMAQCKN